LAGRIFEAWNVCSGSNPGAAARQSAAAGTITDIRLVVVDMHRPEVFGRRICSRGH
jgi:hypothetical protein